MIVVYPMICSGTIAESTLPAIAKTVERYLIVYYMNEIVRDINNDKLVGARNFKIKNDELFLEAFPNPVPGSGSKPPSGGGSNYDAEKNQREREKHELEKRKAEMDAERHGMGKEKHRADLELDKEKLRMDKERQEMEKEKIRRGPIRMEVSQPSIDISPTYVTANTPMGPTFIGVKVVAIRVKSDADLTYYLESDQDLNIVMATAVSVGRGALRKIYSVYDRFIGHRIGSLTPTGDARHDVIYGRSGFSIKGITLVDRNQMSEDFIKSPKHINRMHGLGWDNIILADDINRYAFFCMQKFKGICNSVPYQMLYRSLGQDQVYDSIEQTRVKNSSLFKTGPNFRKLVGESLALKKKEYYLWNENDSFLSEMDLSGFMNKISPSRFKSLGEEIKEKADASNYKGIFKTLHSLGLNEEHVNAAFEKGKETDDELVAAEEMARKVMKNSLPHETLKNSKLVDNVAKSIAFTASIISKKHGNSTKRAAKHILEEFIPKVRSFYDEQKEEETSTTQKTKRPRAAIYHTIEAAIGIIWISFWGAVIIGAYILVATHIWTFIGVLAASLAIAVVLQTLLKFAQDAGQSTALTTT